MRLWMILAGLAGALAVAVGAFAAHAMEGAADARAVALVNKAADYMLWHSLALGLVAVLAERMPGRRSIAAAGGLFTIGIALFCGSLLTIAFTGWSGAAAAAPFGGTSFILGWLALAWAGLRRP